MQTRPAATPLLAALLGFALPAMAQHTHAPHEPAAATALPAQLHATDAPLREGMARIHGALEELRHYELGHMPKSEAIERVEAIQAATDYLFANCKLDAQADAALHGMLAPLLAGVQAFRMNPDDTSTVAAMRQAVADYPRVFDDPQWRAETEAPSPPNH
jgi:hypothetical protein